MAKQIDASEEKIWGAISYLWILSLVALVVKKDNAFVKFHASQGILLFVISLVLMFVPIIGWLINLIIGIIAIVGIIKALQGEKWQIPLISDLSQKFGDWIIKTDKL